MSGVFLIELERWVYRPGDVVRGRVTVRLGHDSRELTAALSYVESSGDVEEVYEEVRTPPLYRGDLPAGLQCPFELVLPQWAKPALWRRIDQLGPDVTRGLWWEVRVKSDKPGFDKHGRAQLTVAPPGTPV